MPHPVLRVAMAAALALCPLAAHAAATIKEGPAVFDVPVDFVLFALTLAGVALFHHHTLKVALTGLAVIVLYKLGFTGFKFGPGLQGFVSHLEQRRRHA